MLIKYLIFSMINFKDDEFNIMSLLIHLIQYNIIPLSLKYNLILFVSIKYEIIENWNVLV